jgi:class 3 adenylate cyclase
MAAPVERPRVRFSLRWKITLPFMFLALMLGLGATVIVSQLYGQAEEIRFLRQLRDSGLQAADEVVRIEERLLEIERAIANTEGVPGAVALGDSEALRERVFSLVINANADLAAVLDSKGVSLLAVRRSSLDQQASDYLVLRNEDYYQEWPFVRRVLRLDEPAATNEDAMGSKQAGLHSILLSEDETFVLFVAGPLVDDRGTVFGAVLVGEYLDNLVLRMSEDARAQISIYDSTSGRCLITTFESEATWDPPGLTLPGELVTAAYAPEGESNPYRTVQVAGHTYGEVLVPFQVKQGTEDLGVLGTSLLGLEDTDVAYQLYQQRVVWIIGIGALGIVLIVTTGLLISNWITRPLVGIAAASAQVATGNLETRVSEKGSDEIGLLARTFNRMVEGLQEGAFYRDLLGRTVSPQVRKKLRKAFTQTNVLLDGKMLKATILFAGLRGFTPVAEEADPTEIMQTLNTYFAGIVPIITRHGGVVNKFDGDVIMAFFGILPNPAPPQVSALQAVHAAVEMLEFVDRFDEEHGSEDFPVMEMGIGVSTGPVIAGGLGTKDRLQYTVIGDTVNIAQRIHHIASDPASGDLLISEDTYTSLASAQTQFEFGRQGLVKLQGESQEVTIFEVLGRTTRLVDASLFEEGDKTAWRDDDV